MTSRRAFVTNSGLALAGLLSGCTQGMQLPPWQLYSGFNRMQQRALEGILREDSDDHTQSEHQENIEWNLVSVYTQHPERGNHYAATGLHLTNGIILTVDHVIDDTLLVDPNLRHFIERDRHRQRITHVLARHPQYDLALIQIEDQNFMDSVHLHIGNPYQDLGVNVLAYQTNRITSSRTTVLSDSNIVLTTDGNTHIDMFRIRQNYNYRWSGSAVVCRQSGHLIGLVSSSPIRERHEYTSCSRVTRITGTK